MSQIAENIKKIRKLLKQTQSVFASKMDVTVAMQKSYEGSKAIPDLIYLERLSAKIDIPAIRLLSENISLPELVKKVEKVSRELQMDDLPLLSDPKEEYKKKSTDDNYVRLLEDNDRYFKDLVKSNLSKSDFVQHSILAYLKAIVKKGAEDESQGSASQEKQLLIKMGKRIASYMELPVEKDIVPGK